MAANAPEAKAPPPDPRTVLLLVMAYDLLIGANKAIEGGGKVKKELQSASVRLSAELAKLLVRARVSQPYQLLPARLQPPTVALPRYVRVNLIRSDLATAIAKFQAEGWQLVTYDSIKELLDSPQGVSKSSWSKVFWRDPHLGVEGGDMLVFPPATDLHAHPLLEAGAIVLQDKASALSGRALEPPPGPNTYCIDACAAPGQKTAQIAQAMGNVGHLFAFDQDAKRLALLKRLAARNNLKNLTAECQSFLAVDPTSEPYRRVEYILLDPSCSGSGEISGQLTDGLPGAVASVDQETEDEDEVETEERLQKLQDFQLRALRHALSFPNVKRVVYSTCSIHDKENEEVVRTILEEHGAKFGLRRLFPTFPGRGKVSIFPTADCCVRTDPNTDHTIGFFVACFERNEKGQADESTEEAKVEAVAATAGESKSAKKRKKRKRKALQAAEAQRAEPVDIEAPPAKRMKNRPSKSEEATQPT